MPNMHLSDCLIKYMVQHDTVYHYTATVNLSQQMLHIKPRDFAWQTCEQYTAQFEPGPNEQIERRDFFGNWQTYISMLTPHNRLRIRSTFTACLKQRPDEHNIDQQTSWEQALAQLHQHLPQHSEAMPYLYFSPAIPRSTELAEYAAPSFTPNRPLYDAVFDLNQRIFHEFTFDPQATDISTPLHQVLANRRGVCQDFAHLMTGCLRSMGFACRYMSGYILTAPPPGQPRMIGADASHAWISLYFPSQGWIDFDPTNNCLVQNQHITVGWGRDFNDVSPIHGLVLGGGKQELSVGVTVTPL